MLPGPKDTVRIIRYPALRILPILQISWGYRPVMRIVIRLPEKVKKKLALNSNEC